MLRVNPKRSCCITMFVLAALLVCAALPVSGTTYYVNWSTGNNSNDGYTPETAWKDIDNGERGASPILLPGDIVEVARGTYKPGASGYVFRASGVSGLQITYHANGRVVIDGEGLCDQVVRFSTMGGGLSRTDIVWDGFEITGGVHYALNAEANNDDITIKNCTFRDSGTPGASYDYLVNQYAAHHWTYINNVFRDMPAGTSYWCGGVGIWWTTNADTTKFHNNTFSNTASAAVHMIGSSAPGAEAPITFKNNICANMPMGVYNWYNDTLVVSNNLFFNIGTPYWDATHSVALPGGAGDVTGDPKFFSSINFSITAGSAAIDAGASLSQAYPYIGSAYDIGAYEFNPSPAPAVIKGTITDFNMHSPVSGAVVEIADESKTFTTGADGTYTISLAVPGPHPIKVTAATYPDINSVVNAVSGAEVTQDFALGGSGIIAGRVTISDSDPVEPMEGVKVEVVGIDTYVFTDANGNYQLTVPSGTGRVVKATYLGFEDGEVTVDVPVNGTVPADFPLVQIPGTTYYVNNDPLAGGNYNNDGLAKVYDSETGHGPWATIDAPSRWRNLLKPGDTVLVQPGTYSDASNWSVYVTAGQGTRYAPITYKADIVNPWDVVITAGAGGRCLHVQGTTDYNVFDGFKLADTTYGSLLYDKNTTIRNCFMDNMGSHGLWVLSEGIRVEHNILKGIGGYAVLNNGSNCRVYNNTIVNCGYGVAAANDAQNNIIMGTTNYAMQWVAGQFNLFWSNGSDYDFAGGANYGTGEFNADPMLDADYKPLAGSPAINTGANVGIAFTGPAPDRGWFETDDLTPVSFLSGRVLNGATGDGISGATIEVSGRPNITTGVGGTYATMLPATTYTVTVSAVGFTSVSESVTLAGGNNVKNFMLLPTGTVTVGSIGELKALGASLPNDNYATVIPVVLANQVAATVNFPVSSMGSIFIEEINRSAGILVYPVDWSGTVHVNEGDRMKIAGRLTRDGTGELFLWAGTFIGQTSGTPLTPLGMNNKTSKTVTGLLVKVWGNVTASGPGYIYVDDGCGLNDGLGVATGIRVELGSLTAPTSGFVVLTGHSSLAKVGSTPDVPVVRPRYQSDIQ